MSLKSKYFDLRELVNPDIYNHPAIGERCADWLNPYAFMTLDAIKENTNDIITINDWMWGGSYVDSGMRCPFTIPSAAEIHEILTGSGSEAKMREQLIKAFQGVGARFSGHKFGGSFDLKPKHQIAEELYYHILSNQSKYPFIHRMEDIKATTPTGRRHWVHIDLGTETRAGDIIIFTP